MSRCFSTGALALTITGTGTFESIGGLLGITEANGDIADVYSQSDISCTGATSQYVSGLIGYLDTNLENAYSTGLVTATAGSDIGGLIGYTDPTDGTTSNCFWDTETSGQAASDGGTGKTTAQMQDIITFQGAEWAISTFWNVYSGCANGYPCLIDVNLCCPRSLGVDQTITGNKVSLEAIRNLEIVYGGRFYIDKSGNAAYESRYHRNV